MEFPARSRTQVMKTSPPLLELKGIEIPGEGKSGNDYLLWLFGKNPFQV